MNIAQWLWEYQALIEKEKEETQRQFEFYKLCKLTIIKLLGLDILLNELTDEEVKEVGRDNVFMPWVMLGGRREIANMAFKKMDEISITKSAIEDEEFEKLSSAIARGDDLGDMEPILDAEATDRVFNNWNKKIQQEELQKAGVKLVDRPNKKTTHIKFDREEMLQRARQSIAEVAEAQKRVEEQLKHEDQIHSGAYLTFDDDA